MTAHWIDPHTLNQHKAAIACTRITGRHTYDVLASKIKQVLASYSLAGKVCAMRSNFVKAFTVFSDSASANCTTEEEEGEDVTFENVDELLSLDPEEINIDDDLTQVQFDLPPHYRCVAHTLNLVACKMSTNSFHLPLHQRVCTATHLQRALLFGIRQADQQ